MKDSTNISFEMSGRENSPFHVSIEGNIGSGKSSVLAFFKKFEEFECNPEPVQKWRNFQGHNLLELMYREPSNNTFAFQIAVQLSRYNELARFSGKEVRFFERTLDSSKFVFSELAHKEGNLADHELAIIDAWFEQLKQSLPPIGLYIYLRTSPQIAIERIRKRDRPEESNLDVEFVTKLHDLHEQWMVQEQYGPLGAKLLTIDADRSQEEVMDQLLANMEIIKGLK